MKWLPKVMAMTILWGAVGYIIWKVEPQEVRDVGVAGMYLPMVGLVMLASWYSALIVTKSWKAAILLSMIIGVALVTQILGWMNWLIAISLLGLAVALGLTLVDKS